MWHLIKTSWSCLQGNFDTRNPKNVVMENPSMSSEKFWSTIDNANLKSKGNLEQFTVAHKEERK